MVAIITQNKIPGGCESGRHKRQPGLVQINPCRIDKLTAFLEGGDSKISQ
jgi:hypothetical protein